MSNSIINQPSRTINIGLGAVVTNLKTKKECRWFCQKMGKFFYKSLGLFFPPFSCFDTEFILQFGSDKKKVSLIKLNN